MNRMALSLRVILGILVSVALVLPGTASAVITNPTPQRSYVSLSGLDTNNCGPTAPCRTWQAALAQTQPGGEILTLNSGGFGTLIINQAVTLTIPPGVYGGMSPLNGVSGVVINAPGAVVQLIGVTINGQPGAVDGVDIQAAGQVLLERATIANTQVGVNFAASGGALKMRDSVIKATSSSAISASLSSGGGTVSVTSCQFQGNGTGTSSAAINIGDNIVFQSDASSYSFNPGWGVLVAGSGASGATSAAMVDNNQFEFNGSGGISLSQAGSTAAVYSMLEYNTFIGNGGTAVSASGPLTVDLVGNSIYGFATGISMAAAAVVSTDGANTIRDTTNAYGGGTLNSSTTFTY